MFEFRATRRDPPKEERDIEDPGRDERDAEVTADIGLKWDGFKMARDGRSGKSFAGLGIGFSREADVGLLPGAKPIDVDGLRSLAAEEGRDADIEASYP
jgi:hypothetical protein